VAAAGSWLAGQLAWDVSSVAGVAPSPSAADVAWWGFAILVIAGLLRPARGSRAVRLVMFVEALPVAAAAMALTFAWLWSDAAASPLAPAARASALVYPVVYVTAAVLTLHAVLASPLLRRVIGIGPALVLAGVVVEAAGFVVWSKELLDNDYVPGATVVDYLWVIGMVGVGIGGALCMPRARSEAPPADEPSRRGGVLPAATFLLLIAALVQAQLAHAQLGTRLTLALGLLISGTTLIGRGALLQRRLRALLSRERSAGRELAAREADLARANDRLSEDVRHDALTGLLNRRALMEDLPKLNADAASEGTPFAFVLCDFDHFKAYNDRLGHLAGDQALRAVSAAIRAELRSGDRAYRYGGEEILIVLRDLDDRAAVAAAERIRRAVADAAIPHPDGIRGVITLSGGISSGCGDATGLLAQADAALYAAKEAGRDRMVAAAPELAPEALPLPGPRQFEEPVLRHLRGVLNVARAAAAGDVITVTEALAENIRREPGFRTVAVNLLDAAGVEAAVVAVAGDADARAALIGSSSPWCEWQRILASGRERRGAIWLPAGTVEWDPAVVVWTRQGPSQLHADAWHPDDVLLLPLRSATDEIIGVVSVDEPQTGLRPDDAELEVLMTLAAYGGIAIEHAQRAGSRVPEAVAGP
jgi:diguanylate cyclase (GGDEF)-like protein